MFLMLLADPVRWTLQWTLQPGAQGSCRRQAQHPHSCGPVLLAGLLRTMG